MTEIKAMLPALIPIALFQYGLAIFCAVKIIKEGVANLSKLAWLIIIFLVNIIGPIAFLLVGRRRDTY